MPIFQSSIFELDPKLGHDHLKYIRTNNLPNQEVLGKKLAGLENAEAGLVTGSGTTAIFVSLFTVLGKGGHLLVQDRLYGGTHVMLTTDMASVDFSFDFIDTDDPGSWEAKLKPNTRAIYTEAMTNPVLQVAPHREVVAFAKKHGLISMIDNTFATPINFRPAEFGYDLSLHSCSKFLNGHSDLVAGAIIGREDLIHKITRTLNHLGGHLDPHSCFLLHRGMKTLAVRVRHQNQSALEIARFMEQEPGVGRVFYPGLESHPNFATAQELFEGYGGVFSFELEGDTEIAERFINQTQIPIHTFSLGGPETLLIQPSLAIHSSMTEEEQKKAGLSDSLIRCSVGLENTEELIQDFQRALKTACAPVS